jgi:hypothetical protein
MATQGKWDTAYRLASDNMYSQEVFDDKGDTIAYMAWHSVTLPDGSIITDREENARLIVTAVNFFKSFNPKNPQAAAESLKDLVRACKKWTRGEIDNAVLSDAIMKAGIR